MREKHYIITIEVISDKPLNQLKKICKVSNYSEPDDLSYNLSLLLNERPASIGCKVDENPIYDEEA